MGNLRSLFLLLWGGCATASPCVASLSTHGRDIVGHDQYGHTFVCDCQSADAAECTWEVPGTCGSGRFATFALTGGAISADGFDSGDDDTYEITEVDVAKLHQTCREEFADSGTVP